MTRKRLTTILLFVIALAGLSLLLYPFVADLWNSRHASRLIADYDTRIAEINELDYTVYWDAAKAYNEHVRTLRGKELTEELAEEYESVLDVSGVGIMGYVEVPKINVTLPIYHGSDPAVLQVGIGHLEWSDLPIGGRGNHCVLSGHRGLSSAKLLSDLPQMQLGDVFYIRVLNEMLTYQVDQIVTVLPEDLDALERVPGKDYCSLVTCTPYGINTHRLIVRGHRISNTEESETVMITSEAVRVQPYLVAAVLFAGAVVILMIYLIISTAVVNGRKKKG